MVFAVLSFSIPVFVLAYMLIFVFSLSLDVLPVQGYASIADGIWPFVERLILPSIALGLTFAALIARITRASMLEVLSQDYIRTARAKGVLERWVVMKHALKNALLPVVTIIGLQFGTLLSGAILTETIFSWPGIGSWIYEGILARDYPVVQGGVVFVAIVFVLINLLVDISYALLDPRIQYK